MARISKVLAAGALRRASVFNLVAVVLGWAALLESCSSCKRYREPYKSTMEQIERESGLSFACGARVTHFEETPPVDPVWVARVAIPGRCVAEFSKSVASHAVTTLHVPEPMGPQKVWWSPKKIVLQRQYELPQGGAIVSVVLEEGSAEFVAYIERTSY